MRDRFMQKTLVEMLQIGERPLAVSTCGSYIATLRGARVHVYTCGDNGFYDCIETGLSSDYDPNTATIQETLIYVEAFLRRVEEDA